MSVIQTRAATCEPSSYNQERNTLDVIFSTGAEVTRWDAEGQYQERLELTAEAVDLSRLNGGPVLNAHDRWSITSVLGVVEASTVDGKRGLATIRFGARPEIAGLVTDIRGGVIRDVSVGYTVQEWKETRNEKGARVKTGTRWTPQEISFTPIGADPAAKVRGENMDNDVRIRQAAELMGVPDFAEGLIARGTTMEQARGEILAEAQRTAPRIDGRAPVTVAPRFSLDDRLRAMADALLLRVNPAHKVGEEARPYVGRRMADLMREALRERGISTMGGDAEIITRSLHGTSDFPNLLSNVANKTLAASYQLAPSGMKTVCRMGAPVADFKPRSVLRRGELPMLEKVNENGEFKRGAIAEAKDSYSIGTYGKVFGMTRQALINDDLGAFADVARGWGIAAAEFENSFLVDLLTSNSGNGPTLGDGVVMFHTATHKNKAGTGNSTTDISLGEARLALRTQKGLDGKTPVNMVAKYLLVPAAMETAAERYLAEIYPATAANVNPFGGTNKLELVVDPRLDAKSPTRWYVFSDPGLFPVIEYAYLAGYEGLQVETRAGFDVDGVEIRARLDFGAGGIDFRGAFMNPGA